MIRSQSGKLYTGISTNVERRFAEHAGEAGKNKGARFFRGDPPVAVVYREQVQDRSAASKREAEIKAMSRAGKLDLFQ